MRINLEFVCLRIHISDFDDSNVSLIEPAYYNMYKQFVI